MNDKMNENEKNYLPFLVQWDKKGNKIGIVKYNLKVLPQNLQMKIMCKTLWISSLCSFLILSPTKTMNIPT